MKTNTALYVLEHTNYNVEVLNRFADIKHVNYDELTDVRTIVFNDNSYIEVHDERIIWGIRHDGINLYDDSVCGYSE